MYRHATGGLAAKYETECLSVHPAQEKVMRYDVTKTPVPFVLLCNFQRAIHNSIFPSSPYSLPMVVDSWPNPRLSTAGNRPYAHAARIRYESSPVNQGLMGISFVQSAPSRDVHAHSGQLAPYGMGTHPSIPPYIKTQLPHMFERRARMRVRASANYRVSLTHRERENTCSIDDLRPLQSNRPLSWI